MVFNIGAESTGAVTSVDRIPCRLLVVMVVLRVVGLRGGGIETLRDWDVAAGWVRRTSGFEGIMIGIPASFG